jgi:hypothetical protein
MEEHNMTSISMRYVAISLCVFATACAGEGPTAPMSPSSSIGGAAVAEAQGASQLPFRGTLEASEIITGSPPVLQDVLTGTGEATHLGRFTATFEYVIHLDTLTSDGSFALIAANGDRISGTLTGAGTPSDVGLMIVENATITGGTGRFANATGSFRIERLHDYVTFNSSGSFAGTVNLGY